jgi:acyl carrier protein
MSDSATTPTAVVNKAERALAEIKSILSERWTAEEVTLETTFVSLEMDDLDVLELSLELEDRLDMDLLSADLSEIVSIQHLVDAAVNSW